MGRIVDQSNRIFLEHLGLAGKAGISGTPDASPPVSDASTPPASGDVVELSPEGKKILEESCLTPGRGPGLDTRAIMVRLGEHEPLPAGQRDETLASIISGWAEMRGRHEKPQCATSARGTAIQVSRTQPYYSEAEQKEILPTDVTFSMSLSQANGRQLSLEFTDDVRMQEYSDGSMSVYFSDTGKTRTYGSDGSISEIDGDSLDVNANTIFVNVKSMFVDTGNSGSTVFNFSDGAMIQCGSGDDTIVIANKTRTNINAGDGNNSITGEHVTESSITMGNGNNTVNLSFLFDSELSAGDGANNIYIGEVSVNSNVNIGDGDNHIRIYDVTYNALVSIGDGNNHLSINATGAGMLDGIAFIEPIFLNSKKHCTAQVTLGDGNNIIEVDRVKGSSEITVGNGDNEIKADYFVDSGKLNCGNGNNKVNVHTLDDTSSLNIGNGNNFLRVYNFYEDAMARLGNGNNDIGIYNMLHNASLEVGDGNNTIEIGLVDDTAHISTGKGRNALNVSKASSEAFLLVKSGLLEPKRESIPEKGTSGVSQDFFASWHENSSNFSFTESKGKQLFFLNKTV